MVGALNSYRGETVVAFVSASPGFSNRCNGAFQLLPRTPRRLQVPGGNSCGRGIAQDGDALRSCAIRSGTKYAAASGDYAWTSLKANAVARLAGRIRSFMAEHIYPNERRFYQEAERLEPVGSPPGCRGAEAPRKRVRFMEPFPAAARGRPERYSNTRPCAKSWAAPISPRKFSTAAPPTPGTWRRSCATGPRPRRRSLARARIRWRNRIPAFAMTEPDVASSDATNVASSMVRDGDDYVINGRKWYTTGADRSPGPRLLSSWGSRPAECRSS